jgi:uncharacterized protein
VRVDARTVPVFPFDGQTGSGPGPHRHPYDEVQFIPGALAGHGQRAHLFWMIRESPLDARPAPWLCLIGILAWSWAFYGAAIMSGRPWLEFPASFLVAVGGLGPIIIPALLISTGRWDASLDSSVGSFFRRALNPRTVPVRWYAAVLVVVLVLYVSPLVLDRDGIERRLVEGGPMAFLLVGLAFGALEEPGWRGYAQEGLQRELSVGAASLIIGIVWAVWHIPLFFIEGTYQWHLGVGTPAFWSFLAVLVATAPVFAWLYNGAGNATFAPVIAHGLGNVVGEITADPTPWASALVTAAAGVVALLWIRWSGRSQRLSLLDPYGRHQGPGL